MNSFLKNCALQLLIRLEDVILFMHLDAYYETETSNILNVARKLYLSSKKYQK